MIVRKEQSAHSMHLAYRYCMMSGGDSLRLCQGDLLRMESLCVQTSSGESSLLAESITLTNLDALRSMVLPYP